MICEIIASAWRACLEPDPQDDAAKPFAADVIISNPVTYAHCHCAEALGIPLHLMFPQVSLFIMFCLIQNFYGYLCILAVGPNQSISSSFI